MTFAYFAYPIDVPWTGDHFKVNNTMTKAGWVVYDPGMRFRSAEPTQKIEVEPDPRVQEINDQAIDRADIMVALLPVESHSVGVPLEIQRAARRGIPVYVYRQKRSWAIAVPGVYQFKTLDALCQAIEGYAVDRAALIPRVQFTDVSDLIPVPTIKVNGPGQLPIRHHADDAGLDLYAYNDSGDGEWTIDPGDYWRIPCGVAVEPPPGWWCWIVGRSSTFERGLLVNQGIIDPGFRGELFVIVRNVSDEVVTVRPGERLAQLIPIPLFPTTGRVERVEQLSESARGTNGFGSSGR